ncbi:hypothetical protein RchiOBHm_Chr7g0239451 [Rosa chinensis]|uniref:Secreted protein n=1 Tax=Rosa chinensis TaxID=74649 RepID=A0A2P6PHR2_ROSCH|nr:hypothetical protein RchiOBHm_Chr7g0239451 [Rosa chinensis]
MTTATAIPMITVLFLPPASASASPIVESRVWLDLRCFNKSGQPHTHNEEGQQQ